MKSIEPNQTNWPNWPNLPKLSKLSKIVKKLSKLSKIVQNVKYCQNCQICQKIVKIMKNCQNVSQVMFPHHCDQLSQRSLVSSMSKKQKVAQWLSEWVSEWQGHLLSCQVTAKKGLGGLWSNPCLKMLFQFFWKVVKIKHCNGFVWFGIPYYGIYTKDLEVIYSLE